MMMKQWHEVILSEHAVGADASEESYYCFSGRREEGGWHWSRLWSEDVTRVDAMRRDACGVGLRVGRCILSYS